METIGFRKEYDIENSASYVTSIIPDTGSPISPNVAANGIKIPSNILKVGELRNG